MKFEIRTSVVNGHLKRNKNLIIDAINFYEGKDIVVTINKAGKQRSMPQNRYYWGCLIPLLQSGIKESWGEVYTKEAAHELLKAKFLFYERVNEDTGEILRVPKSTTENTTSAQEDFHHEVRQFLFDWFGIDAPLPNEEITMDL